jgi:hypothetical protein
MRKKEHVKYKYTYRAHAQNNARDSARREPENQRASNRGFIARTTHFFTHAFSSFKKRKKDVSYNIKLSEDKNHQRRARAKQQLRQRQRKKKKNRFDVVPHRGPSQVLRAPSIRKVERFHRRFVSANRAPNGRERVSGCAREEKKEEEE